jgi:threonyl-tRNA synthetase
MDYADKVCEDLKKENIRVSVDTSADSLNKKIRNAELMKVPYILIVGEKEVNSNGVSVRVFKTKEQYEQSEAEFIKTAVEKRDTRAL